MKRANPSNIFQEDEDGTRCNRHVWQLSLAQHALDANTWAGGGSLGYFAHASEIFTEARLSQTLQNVRIGGFVPPFFFVHYPYLSLQATFQRTCCLPAGTHLASSSLILFPSLSLLFNSPFLTPNLDIEGVPVPPSYYQLSHVPFLWLCPERETWVCTWRPNHFA